MQAQLAEIAGDLNSALVRLGELRKNVPAAVWSRRPAPERWSPGECVAHLNLTSRAMIPLLRAGLNEARGTGAAAPSRYSLGLMGWLLWKSMSPSGSFRVKTRPPFVPSGDRSPDELVTEFQRLQAEQITCVREADGLPLQRVKVVSPFEARIRYNLFAALSFLPRHQHRHLLQAERAASS